MPVDGRGFGLGFDRGFGPDFGLAGSGRTGRVLARFYRGGVFGYVLIPVLVLVLNLGLGLCIGLRHRGIHFSVLRRSFDFFVLVEAAIDQPLLWMLKA